jgi:hypothetical protein
MLGAAALGPYNSQQQPLDLVFRRDGVPGGPVFDWSVRVSIGMTKASCIKLILTAVFDLGLRGAELNATKVELQALLICNAIYDPGHSEEDQRRKTLGKKNREATRERADVFQNYVIFNRDFVSKGVAYKNVIAQAIKNHNEHLSELGRVNEDEEACLIQWSEMTDKMKQT